ncbi:MAG: hypothetical protein HYZ91_05045 [Candidatus Omnitrophica bacterium]|nr:hypothetical protein [Candidatus Omnitrophota bacterium]
MATAAAQEPAGRAGAGGPSAAQPSAKVEEPAATEPAGPRPTEAEVAAKLNGTQWAIDLRAMFGEGQPAPINDVLSFERGTISSKRLSDRGYVASAFTISVADSGVPVWETMQTSQDDGVVLWRAELHGEKMIGSLSKYPVEGSSEDYVFEGQPAQASQPAADQSSASSAAGSTAAPPASVKAAEPAPGAGQPQAQPPAAPSANKNEPSKKPRKGWFRRESR